MATVKVGAIRARRDRPGTYEATYYVNRQRRRVSAESREAVSSKIAELLTEAEKEPDVCGVWDPNVTLGEYADSWIEDQDHLEPKTLQSYRHLLFNHVLPFKIDQKRMGDWRLKDLRRRHVKALAMAKKKSYANDSVRLMRSVLSSLLTDAVDDEIIDVNPALLLFRKKKGKEKRNQEEIRAMEDSEFQTFVENAKKERTFGAFLVTLGKTGLRPSEAIALMPTDVKFDRRVLRVDKVYVDGRIRPYTKNGMTREVDMSSELVEFLRTHMAKLREEYFKRGEPMPEMLFPNSAGNHIDWYDAARAFRRICKNAKIGPFRPYELRHTFASLLLASGAPLTYVAAQLGHRRATTTLRYYARWLPKDGRRYVDALDVCPHEEAAEAVLAR